MQFSNSRIYDGIFIFFIEVKSVEFDKIHSIHSLKSSSYDAKYAIKTFYG